MSEVLQGSSTTHDLIYDVYLNFRGTDTRFGFIDHLHKTLIDANLNTFLDDEEIQTGQDLKPELERAIKASRASIIVLSENYASSTWCLDELVLILDQKRTSGHIVIPIFYHVDPSDVRRQRGRFRDAIEKHKQMMETETSAEKKTQLAHKIETWMRALTDVANLSGIVATDRQERKFIEEMVKSIYLMLHGQSRITTLPLLFGMNDSIEFITSWLKDGSSDTTHILAILGMVGIGKTYLANYIYGKHSHLFYKSSFIEGIDAKCAANVKGLVELQNQLCVDIVQEVFENTSMIDHELARHKVFIVLDDIGSLHQLDELIGNKCFHPGSKIIITTRDASLTQRCALFKSIVKPTHTPHVLQGLHDNNASLQLLSYHAFMSKGPEKGYERVSEEIIEYCQGHPLALKLLGESLRKRSVAEWEDYIENLKEEPDSLINFFLQMSFNSLPSVNDKELFKHIACFFIGEDRDFTETVLEACGINAISGIKNLIDRCLLVIGPSNELKMHRLLQEMGRDVVCQESPDKPHKRSRLWCHKESFQVLKQKTGKGNLIGLALDMKMLEKEEFHGSTELKTNALSKMDNLMLLKLNYVQLTGSYKKFPEGLRWLCMHGFPLKSIPSDLAMQNLVALDMSFSALESFDMSFTDPQLPGKRQKLTESCSKDEILLRSLKILNLSFCEQLRVLGGFIELPALERLILANCIGLIEVCESIEQCDELVLVDLSYCNMLEKFPTNMLKKVRTVLLDGCSLGQLPVETKVVDAL